jgi:hypothetical protein
VSGAGRGEEEGKEVCIRAVDDSMLYWGSRLTFTRRILSCLRILGESRTDPSWVSKTRRKTVQSRQTLNSSLGIEYILLECRVEMGCHMLLSATGVLPTTISSTSHPMSELQQLLDMVSTHPTSHRMQLLTYISVYRASRGRKRRRLSRRVGTMSAKLP